MKSAIHLVRLGRKSEGLAGQVSVPPCRAATSLQATVAERKNAAWRKYDSLYYGRWIDIQA